MKSFKNRTFSFIAIFIIVAINLGNNTSKATFITNFDSFPTIPY